MSKEKECKCCHEWWYGSDVKEGLCPNCYYYFKQLKQQLEEKEKQIDIISRDNNLYKYNIDEQKRIIDDFAKQLKEKDNYHLRYELAGADETIANLRQQLAEKQNTIDEINKEFVQAVHDWKTLCKKKDKEIEKLRKILNFQNINAGIDIKEMWADLFIKQVDKNKQLAIQELEKVKNKCNGMYELWLDSNYKENMYDNEDIAGVFEDISVFTNDLIKKLKGE